MQMPIQIPAQIPKGPSLALRLSSVVSPAVALFVSLVVTLGGCSLYRSPDRESFNGNARAGAPAAVAVALIECHHVNSALMGSQLETVQINRASPDGIHVLMSKRLVSTNPQSALCHFLAAQENDPSDQSLSDAIRPVVERFLLGDN